MTSRERVRRALEFARPDRVPRNLWVLPIAWQEHGQAALADFQRRWPGDIESPPGNVAPPPRRVRGDRYAVGQFRDEWGCVFENVQAGIVGEVKSPLVDDWSKLEDVEPPMELLEVDVDAVNRFCAASERFVNAPGVDPFERMQKLRGAENLLMDLAEEPDGLHALIAKVHAFNLRRCTLWAGTDVDGLRISDDWGSQRALLISPEQWRRVFKPLYADYARIAHDAGKKVFMHSDGVIIDIFEDLIEVGIDAINSQLFCMDIAELGRRFGGRITFWGEIDRQRTLPFGNVAEVRDAVRRVVEQLYRPEGGVIAQFEIGPGTKMDNAEAVYETWRTLTDT